MPCSGALTEAQPERAAATEPARVRPSACVQDKTSALRRVTARNLGAGAAHGQQQRRVRAFATQHGGALRGNVCACPDAHITMHRTGARACAALSAAAAPRHRGASCHAATCLRHELGHRVRRISPSKAARRAATTYWRSCAARGARRRRARVLAKVGYKVS